MNQNKHRETNQNYVEKKMMDKMKGRATKTRKKFYRKKKEKPLDRNKREV